MLQANHSLDITNRISDRALLQLSIFVLMIAGHGALAPVAAHAQQMEWIQRSANGPSPRRYIGLVYDSFNAKTLLFGGSVNRPDQPDGQTWTWDGANWVNETITGPSPSPRWAHAMAYDPDRHKAVLFGGYLPGDNGETWEWDSATHVWTLVAVSGPPSRRVHAMAYDRFRHETVLFGGESDEQFFNDTWVWNGIAWSQRNVNGPAPSPRSHTTLAYDESRGVTVLFGGLLPDITPSGETWEWNGQTWTERYPSVAPPPSQAHSAGFDSNRGVTVVFGGDVTNTWAWNGSVWSQYPIADPPQAYDAGMVYDSSRQVVVFFGGGVPNPIAETWELVHVCNPACCDSIDFNNDTSLFDPQDIDVFLSVYSEGPCIPATATCNDIDFNNDGSIYDPCDIDSFLTVYSEGPCTLCGL